MVAKPANDSLLCADYSPHYLRWRYLLRFCAAASAFAPTNPGRRRAGCSTVWSRPCPASWPALITTAVASMPRNGAARSSMSSFRSPPPEPTKTPRIPFTTTASCCWSSAKAAMPSARRRTEKAASPTADPHPAKASRATCLGLSVAGRAASCSSKNIYHLSSGSAGARAS